MGRLLLKCMDGRPAQENSRPCVQQGEDVVRFSRIAAVRFPCSIPVVQGDEHAAALYGS